MLEEIKSPCVGVCAIDDISGFCHGCHRTIDEIKGWWDMSQSQQKNLLSQLGERQMQNADFGD